MTIKSFASALAVMACLWTAAVADHHEGEAWFDMENCAMCKQMASHQELMASMQWETHVIDNGMLSVATIPAEHQKTMHDLHLKMKQTGAQLQAGKEMELCGFCDSYGKLMQAGAKEQEIKASFGMINMLTSDDPELAEQIKKHARRTIKEYNAFLKANAPGSTQ